MPLRYHLKRIVRFFYHRRGEFLSRAFWKNVIRVIHHRYSLFGRVLSNEFEDNLRRIEKRPWNLHVEVTNICNANCIFCAYQYQERKQVIMEEQVYLKALNEYCSMGGGELRLQCCVGDPLVDPHFIERIQEARSRPEITEITTITNGIRLGKVDIERLLKSGLTQMAISTGPWREDLYRAIYRYHNYQKVRENISDLLKRNYELGCPVAIKIFFRSNLPMKQTLELPDYQAVKHFPHEPEFNVEFDTWLGQIQEADLLPGMHTIPLSKLQKEPCFWLYDGPIVFANGNVGLCGCRDYNASSELVVGNIKEESLLDLWQSQKVHKLRESFGDGHFPQICQKCTRYSNLNLYRSKRGSLRAEIVEKLYMSGKH